jgi:hypothetical protein
VGFPTRVERPVLLIRWADFGLDGAWCPRYPEWEHDNQRFAVGCID